MPTLLMPSIAIQMLEMAYRRTRQRLRHRSLRLGIAIQLISFTNSHAR